MAELLDESDELEDDTPSGRIPRAHPTYFLACAFIVLEV
jgi:hypothetical protein